MSLHSVTGEKVIVDHFLAQFFKCGECQGACMKLKERVMPVAGGLQPPDSCYGVLARMFFFNKLPKFKMNIT